MLGLKRIMRLLSAAAISLSLGCSAGASSRENEAARLRSQLFSVQAVACLSPATQQACDPALAASFHNGSATANLTGRLASDQRKGSIWCEGGRPHLRLSVPTGEMTGEFGQVVWEAIWRALKAADLCASAYGRAVSVTRNGQPIACKDPRFDIHDLFDMAIAQAKRGPPAAVRQVMDSDRVSGICELDPQACSLADPSLCPPFLGDPWNGVTAERHERAGSETDVRSEDGGERIETEKTRVRPAQAEITGALGAVLKGARDCLKPDGPMATASVLFRSDGAVQSVEVKGVGAPVKACIEQALRRARVSSFEGPSFNVGVTVRPSR